MSGSPAGLQRLPGRAAATLEYSCTKPGGSRLSALKLLFSHFEDDYRRNARLVSRAALAKTVSEYELFQLAYQAWHGSEPEQQWLEKLFVAYLFTGRVPAWVRDYAQRSLAGGESSRDPVGRWMVQLLKRSGRRHPRQAGEPPRQDRLRA